jgi:hypothetical protein
MARRHTFIDVDENRLELWLKRDRVQLVVIDSRPELAAAELRRFARVVFAEYVAGEVAARLETARSRLREARGRARGELAAAVDGALQAIEDVAAAVAAPAAELVPDHEAGDEADAETEALLAFERALAATRSGASAGPPRDRPYPSLARHRGTRGTRAREGSAPGWGRAA